MEIVALSLVAMTISLGAAVAASWFARRSAVRDVRNDLDDVITAVEKIGRASRTNRMREVRSAASSAQVDNSPPSELVSPASPQSHAELKQQLRQRLRSH